MNFLQVCQRVVKEAAVSGTLSTVVSQTGELANIVNWAAGAYDEICTAHRDWKFLRSSFTLPTVAATQAYLPTACTDTRLGAAITATGFDRWLDDTFRIYLTADGVATQCYFPPTPNFDLFRNRWMFGSIANQRPSTFAVRPDDDALMLGGIPDAVYTVTGDYQKIAPALTVDADVLLIPAAFHMAPVWLAVQKYAGYQEDMGLYDHAGREYAKVLARLELKMLPDFEVGGPLV